MRKPYQIAPLATRSLDLNEFTQLLSETKEAVLAASKGLKTEAVYTKKVEELTAGLDKLKIQLHKVKSSQVAKGLEVADNDRDVAFKTLVNLIRAFSQVKETNTKAAYDKLSRLFAGYKGLDKLSYEKESEAINHLLAALKEESYQTALTQLHLTSHVTTLTQAQRAFETIYKARLKEQQNQNPSQTGRIRQELQEIYDFLVDFTALYTYAYPEIVATRDLHKTLNTIRTRYKALKTGRRKDKSKVNPQSQAGEVVSD